jgi:RNA polymerase sigma factor for flagellar operon FliA
VSDIPSTLGTLADDPEAKLSKEQLMAAVASAIAQLPEREKTIVSLYYVEEMNLKEIGSILGVSESRVSQLLSLTVKQLRAVLTHQD